MNETRLLNYVNPLQGTDSVYTFSNGNTLPLTAWPNGMAAWSPQTDEAGEGWFFHPAHRHIQGIRLTHQPSPWIRDYGHLVLMPQNGPLHLSAQARASSFRPEEAVFAPDYCRIDLLRYQTSMELTPSMRGAMLKLKFGGGRWTDGSNGTNGSGNNGTGTIPAGAGELRLIVAPFAGESFIRIDAGKRRVSGYTRAHFGNLPDNYAMYFILEFDCEINEEASGLFDGRFEPITACEGSGERLGAFVGIRPAAEAQGIVRVRIGTSFIGLEQAERNLRRELGDASFEEVRAAAGRAWEDRLSVIRATDADGDGETDERKMRTLYSCLYRVNLFPRTWHEYGADGEQLHYRPYDGQVHAGPMYSDFGFWDLYRTSLPLYSLLYPSLLAEMAQSWVNIYKQSGWLPKWISPGERSAMPGTLVDAALADVYVKGIRGFDIESAYEGLRKHATQASSDDGAGRRGLTEYDRLGYLPQDRYGESVSNTLDYQYGDFCIAQIAAGLGREDDYRRFMSRAGGYRKLLDPGVGFMRGRKEDGSRAEPFDPLEWGGPYCEGGAWQCSWAVPHDIGGLAELMGGAEAFAAKLDELMTMPPLFRTGTYGAEIHEMSEMAAIDFGQFAISNQPSFHIPYLYAAVGYPARTQYWVRRAAERLFSDCPDGLPGDEDNGSLGAWYVWNALGLYPLCPGTDEYVLGSPLFRSMTVRLEGGGILEIEAQNNGPQRPYWERLTVDGQEWTKLILTHERLAAGAKLVFAMSGTPASRSYSAAELPYSMSRRPE